MTVLARNNRNKLWFGTQNRMEWLPTPNRGADVSSLGWSEGGSLLSGGAWQHNSFNSAKQYIFEWPGSSSREAADRMKSYFNGTYGRGLIYFIDPLIYDMNILPASWADPSIAVGSEANTFVPGVDPIGVPASGPANWDLPVTQAFYDLSNIGGTDPGTLDDSNSVFIPIPSGYQLYLGSAYSFSGDARVRYSRVSLGGATSGSFIVAPSNVDLFSTIVTPNPGEVGVRIWVGKPVGSGAATLSINSIMARLFPGGSNPTGPMKWVGGQGNSGCRFSGPPTQINFSGVNGGQVSYAASFTEVGSWVTG